MRKKFLSFFCICMAIGAIAYGKFMYENSKVFYDHSALLANVDALTQGDNGSFRYPEKSGDAKFCTLYIYIDVKTKMQVGKSESTIAEFEGNASYTKSRIEGLKDRCPNKGKGCDPYSCQEVPY